MSTKNEKTGFPCDECGAQLSFEPGQIKLKCPYCDHTQEIQPADESAEIKEHDYLSALNNPKLV